MVNCLMWENVLVASFLCFLEKLEVFVGLSGLGCSIVPLYLHLLFDCSSWFESVLFFVLPCQRDYQSEVIISRRRIIFRVRR